MADPSLAVSGRSGEGKGKRLAQILRRQKRGGGGRKDGGEKEGGERGGLGGLGGDGSS